MPYECKNHWHRWDIKAGSWSQAILIGVPKYLIKWFIMVSHISGAVAVFIGAATMKFEASHRKTNI